MVTKRWFVILFQAVFVVIFAMGMLFPTGVVVNAEDVPPEETTETTEEETPPEETVPETEPEATQETPDPEVPEEEAAEPTEEVVEGEPEVLEPTEEPELVEELLPEVEPTEDPLLIPLVPLATGPQDSEEDEELDTPAEVLAALPEESELVVLDENGEPLPLVAVEAAEVVVTGDPMWCAGTDVPGSASCITYTTIEAAVSHAQSAGNAECTIYVADDYSSSSYSTIVIDESSFVDSDFNMFLLGGYDLTSGSATYGTVVGQTSVHQNFYVDDITGSLTLANFIITEFNSSSSTVYIEDSEDVTIDNFNINNKGSGHGILVDDSHRITVSNSTITEKSDGYGIKMTDSYKILIINTDVNEYGRDGGVYMSNVQDVVLDTMAVDSNDDHCNGSGCSLDAVAFRYSTNVKLDSVKANSQFGNGFYSYSGDGYLSLIDSVFDDNIRGYGIYIKSQDGPVYLDTVSASGNDEYGAKIQNKQGVTIEDSTFNENENTYGLDVEADTIGISGTQVDNNDVNGAYLWADQWIEILKSSFSYSGKGSGLYASTNDDYILIDGLTADGNENYGASLDAETDLILKNATINENDEEGLWAEADKGSMLLENVEANGNGWDLYSPDGYGMYLHSKDDMTLTNVTSSGNFDFGVNADTDGALTISDSEFNENGWGNWWYSWWEYDGYGAHLVSALDMTITQTTFNFNFNEGLYAEAGSGGGPSPMVLMGGGGPPPPPPPPPTIGNILLENVSADYNGYPDDSSIYGNPYSFGADLTTNGTLTIHNSTFDNNGAYGLYGSAKDGISMTYSSASGNGSDGAILETPGDIEVTCSVFNDNGSIGLAAGAYGLGSTVTLNGDKFSGNGWGDYMVWAGELIENTAYPCGGGTTGGGPAGDGGPYVPPWLAGLIPVTGGDFVSLSCTGISILQLPTGEMVVFNQPMCGYMGAIELVEPEDLPGTLPEGWEYMNGFTVSLLFGEDVIIQLPAGWTDTLAFPILEEQTGDEFHILYWDVTSSGGLGDWVDLGGVKEALKWVKTHNAVGTFLLVL